MNNYVGNIELWNRRKIGFLAPNHVAPLSVLPTLDWAVAMAKRVDIAVMSGYSSSMERDVLSLLKDGMCGIILVLARRHYRVLPEPLEKLLGTGRLLIISTSTDCRQGKKSAQIRNHYIATHADELVMPTTPIQTSSLYELSKQIHVDFIV